MSFSVKDPLKMVELCAGTGAFSLAFQKTGLFKTVYANDIEPSCKATYDLNFAEENCQMTVGDINSIDLDTIPPMDVLTAGFPCQPFSIAGKRMGFEDQRTNVFWTITAIIDKYRPRFVVLENVKNLKSHDKGNTFTIIINSLKDLQYNIKYCLLNTCVVTELPQNRERMYIVCFKNLADFHIFSFPKACDNNLPIADMLQNSVDEKYYYSDRFNCWPLINREVIKMDTIYQYRRYYVRQNKLGFCPTLTANMGTGGHNVPIIKDHKGIRKLTPRECFNLQGFQESFLLPNISDSLLYKQAGNAVSVPVIEQIANNIGNIVRPTKTNLNQN